jgi:hypothetical protein
MADVRLRRRGRRASQQKQLSGGALGGAALGMIGGKAGKNVVSHFGIDEFSIGPSTAGLSDTQVVSVGKAVTDKISVGYEQSLTSASNVVKLTWAFSQRWSLLAKGGSINGSRCCSTGASTAGVTCSPAEAGPAGAPPRQHPRQPHRPRRPPSLSSRYGQARRSPGRRYPAMTSMKLRLTDASRRRLAAMGLIASLLALFGCDQQKVDEAMKKAGDAARGTWNSVKPDSLLFKGIEIGKSTEEDVRRQAGKPEIVWEEADGGRRLEYPRGPEGTTTWMVTTGPDGRAQDRTGAVRRVVLAGAARHEQGPDPADARQADQGRGVRAEAGRGVGIPLV